MDSYSSFRDHARSPERVWASRDESRPKDERPESFYRSRSPTAGYDRRRPNRSRSPMPIDRYEPRRGRDDYMPRDREDRPRRIHSPPANIDRYVPGQLPPPDPVPLTNPMLDPLKMPCQVGFSYFSEWFRMEEKVKEERERSRTGRLAEPERLRGRETQEEKEKDRARIQAAYNAYREQVQAKAARSFVAAHKAEQWFRERYIPEIRDMFKKDMNEFRRKNYARWERDLDAGVFDDFTLEGIPKNESNGAGGMLEKEEGETTANEVMGVGDLVPCAGADIRDSSLQDPTLLIKTIAPHVSRENLVSFCKEHLGEGDGGFMSLSLSDPNPSKRYHRIGWVLLHPAGDLDVVQESLDQSNGDGDVDVPPAPPLGVADIALEAINGKTVKDETKGDFTCHVGVHNPPSHPKYKALWDLFSAPERIEKDLSLAQRLVNKLEEDFGSDFTAMLKIEERVEALRLAGRLPVPANDADKSLAAGRRNDDDDDGTEAVEDGEEEEGVVDEDSGVDDEDLVVRKKQLDLLIEYLRRVFSFCFFCVFESDSVHELTRKCPAGHLRRPRSSLTTIGKEVAAASARGDPFPSKRRSEPLDDGEVEAPEEKKSRHASKADTQLLRAYNWVKTFEEKIMQILEPESVDIRKLGGKPIEEALDDELAKSVKQEDVNKWRCKIPECTKLFKEQHFWRKHVEKRHTEWLANMRQEFELINAYVMDPSRLMPSRTDASSNGHFPPPGGQGQSGTPRGFNLSNYTMNGGMINMAAGFPMPSSGVPFMSGGPPGGAGFGDAEDRGGSGPMRRGGNSYLSRHGSARPGPYDRSSRTPQRWPSDGPGPRRGPPALASGRWDNVGGGSTVGPREAVQGRSLKSYEDLDHVAGGGSGELNY